MSRLTETASEVLEIALPDLKAAGEAASAATLRAIALFLASVITLDCRDLGWGDRDVHTLCAVLRETRPQALQLIDLEGNPVGSSGISALADVLQRGVAPRLKRTRRLLPKLPLLPAEPTGSQHSPFSSFTCGGT